MAIYSTVLCDAQIYYDDRGQGQPIVFIHGWSGNGKYFEPIIGDLLATGKYRIINYDQRGHGASSRCAKGLNMKRLGQDLAELIRFLDLKDVILIGHSMGAMTIYSYIDQFGCDNIKKCVFIDMSPKLVNDEEWKWGYRKAPTEMKDLENTMDLICEDFDQFLFRFHTEMFPDLAQLPENIILMMKPALSGINDTRILSLYWWSMFRSDYRQALKKLTVPVLYFYPDDGLYPKEVAAEFMTKASQSTVKVIECKNATHLVPVEQPAMMVQEIDAFCG